MDYLSFFVSFVALVVSVSSFYFSIRFWREANRPIVTARVITQFGLGDPDTPLALLVENTGNRPARNVCFSVLFAELGHCFDESAPNEDKDSIRRCFSEEWKIPILNSGQSTSNYFGQLSGQLKRSTWKLSSRLDIEVIYEDLDGRRFRHSNPLFIAAVTDRFANANWS
jgi:hypothetical protein